MNTQLSGRIVVMGLSEDTSGMSCRMSRMRKYALASRWNCSNKFLGKNVRMLYLDVETALFYSFLFCIFIFRLEF